MSKKQTTSLKSMVDRQRHHYAATVTQEGQWPQAEPNQGLARMFVIMLLVHIVIIGGIIIYDFLGDGGETRQASAATKPTSSKRTSTASKAESHLPTVAETTPEPIKATPAAQPALEPVESLLPKNASTNVNAGTPAPSVVELPKPQPFTPPAPATLTAKVTGEESKGHLSIVELPPAPKEEPAPAPTAAEPPAKTIITSTEPSTRKEAAKPKSSTSDETRRAVTTNGSTPPHVPTPSDARKSLENDKRTTSNLPVRRAELVSSSSTTKKKVDDTPPAPKKKTDDSSTTPKKKSDSTTASAKSSSGKTVKHTVGKNDTLYSLARRYHTTTDAIVKANTIKNPDILPDGKVLLIPTK